MSYLTVLIHAFQILSGESLYVKTRVSKYIYTGKHYVKTATLSHVLLIGVPGTAKWPRIFFIILIFSIPMRCASKSFYGSRNKKLIYPCVAERRLKGRTLTL